MRTRKLPDADLKLKYRKTFELALAASLFIMLLAFNVLPNFSMAPKDIKAEIIQIKIEDIPPTEQIKQSAPPPRPSIPIPTENEDIPEDLTIETTELDMSEIPPPPPPPIGDDYDTYVFIPYDEAPTPIGGYESIRKNLKYPEIARKAGLQGLVVVGVLIDEQGNSLKTQVLKDSGMNVGFEESAQAAVMTMKWRPARQRDKAVKVWVSIPVRFSLSEAKST
jgi:protein TonB